MEYPLNNENLSSEKIKYWYLFNYYNISMYKK